MSEHSLHNMFKALREEIYAANPLLERDRERQAYVRRRQTDESTNIYISQSCQDLMVGVHGPGRSPGETLPLENNSNYKRYLDKDGYWHHEVIFKSAPITIEPMD